MTVFITDPDKRSVWIIIVSKQKQRRQFETQLDEVWNFIEFYCKAIANCRAHCSFGLKF